MITIKVQIPDKDYEELKADPFINLTEDNAVKGELSEDSYGNTVLVLGTLIYKDEVFNSQHIWPADWSQCLSHAKAKNYKYIDFNGNVYAVDNAKLDYSNVICQREDLIIK